MLSDSRRRMANGRTRHLDLLSTLRFPEALVFDSKLTTYANLDRLNQMSIPFITLRRRGPGITERIYQQPRPAWKRIELEGIAPAYRTSRISDQKISLDARQRPDGHFTAPSPVPAMSSVMS